MKSKIAFYKVRWNDPLGLLIGGYTWFLNAILCNGFDKVYSHVEVGIYIDCELLKYIWNKQNQSTKFYIPDSTGWWYFSSTTRNRNDIENTIKNEMPDVIFHLAGQVAMTVSISDPQKDFETNAVGTFNLLDSIRKFSRSSIIIYSSTNKVYGDLEDIEYIEKDTRYIPKKYPRGFDESLSLNFQSPYGCSKGAADQYILDYAKMFDLNTVVFRHSTIYGSRQFSTFDQGWIGWFCQKAFEIKNRILKEKLTISGNGKQVRDILFIDDAVNLYFMAAKKINN